MKLHLIQKIGLGGIAFVVLLACLFYGMGHFSPFIIALTIPFCVLILIGYSINTGKKAKDLD